jgi:hypothetical protein
LIDPRVVQQARANDRRRRRSERLAARSFRRLVPDADLIARRAGGESLRSLAADYGVSHTTLSRYFRRREVAAELRAQKRKLENQRRPRRSAGADSQGEHPLAELAARIGRIRCPRHPFWMQVSIEDEPGGEPRLVVGYCCWEAELELRRRLQIDHNLGPDDIVAAPLAPQAADLALPDRTELDGLLSAVARLPDSGPYTDL